MSLQWQPWPPLLSFSHCGDYLPPMVCQTLWSQTMGSVYTYWISSAISWNCISWNCISWKYILSDITSVLFHPSANGQAEWCVSQRSLYARFYRVTGIGSLSVSLFQHWTASTATKQSLQICCSTGDSLHCLITCTLIAFRNIQQCVWHQKSPLFPATEINYCGSLQPSFSPQGLSLMKCPNRMFVFFSGT